MTPHIRQRLAGLESRVSDTIDTVHPGGGLLAPLPHIPPGPLLWFISPLISVVYFFPSFFCGLFAPFQSFVVFVFFFLSSPVFCGLFSTQFLWSVIFFPPVLRGFVICFRPIFVAFFKFPLPVWSLHCTSRIFRRRNTTTSFFLKYVVVCLRGGECESFWNFCIHVDYIYIFKLYIFIYILFFLDISSFTQFLFVRFAFFSRAEQ